MDKPVFKFALREDIKEDKRFLPTRAHDTDTGYDVRAAQEDMKPIIIKPMEYFKIPLGFRAICPPGWYYQLHPRSSSFTKKSMHNLIGIVDETWEGFTLFAGQYIPSDNKPLVIEFAEKIGQLIICQRIDAVIEKIDNEELDAMYKERDSARGTGGFGSTSS